MNKLRQAIIETLSYSQLFNYPLRISEIQRYLIGVSFGREDIKNAMDHIEDIIYQSGYYTFSDQIQNINIRKKRESISRAKMQKAIRISRILSFLPSIQLIGVSGSLSMKNCKKEDDIDLFFITGANTLWITRFFVNILLFLLGEKRGREEVIAKDKICPNMFLSISQMTLEKQNLYTAHEIAQLKVLYNKNLTYEYFLNKNIWINRFLPNVRVEELLYKKKNENNHFITAIDKVFFILQMLYMKPHHSIESIGASHALFHPKDKSSHILKYFKKSVYFRTKSISRKGNILINKKLKKSAVLTSHETYYQI